MSDHDGSPDDSSAEYLNRHCAVTEPITDDQEPLTSRPTNTRAADAARAIPAEDLGIRMSVATLTHRVLAAVVDGWVPLALTDDTGERVEPAHEHLQVLVYDGVGDPILRITIAGEHDAHDAYSQPGIYLDIDVAGVTNTIGKGRSSRSVTEPSKIHQADARIGMVLLQIARLLQRSDSFTGPVIAHVGTISRQDSPLASPLVEHLDEHSHPADHDGPLDEQS